MEDGECAIRYTYSEQGKSVSETAILNEVSIYGVRKWIVDMRIWRSRRRAVGSGQWAEYFDRRSAPVPLSAISRTSEHPLLKA